jgi:hypothetical protein
MLAARPAQLRSIVKYARPRQYPRFEVHAAVRVVPFDERVFPVKNVSLGGALIVTDDQAQEQLPPGAVVEVVFFDPANPSFGEIRTEAQVLRHGKRSTALLWMGMSAKLLFDLGFVITRMRG